MRLLLTVVLAASVLLPISSAIAADASLSAIDDAARKAEENARRASQIDINIDDDPQGALCATASGSM